MPGKKDSVMSVIRKKFNSQKVWTISTLYEELREQYPNEDEKRLRHIIRSSINALRQRNEIHRIDHATWEKL